MTFVRRAFGLLTAFGLLGSVASACSATPDEGDEFENAGGASAAGGNAGNAGSINVDGGAGSGGSFAGCAKVTNDGVLVPLDMYVMLDRSGSMDDETGDKWTPVTGAIKDFVQRPDNAGVSMGLGVFPIPPSTPIPRNCTTAAQCGINGPCFGGLCLGADGSCVADDYRFPKVAIGALPGNGSAIVDALNGTRPTGSTTTSLPALTGALDYAEIWAKNVPDHITLVIFATDGDPSGCNEAGNNNIAKISARAAQSATATVPVRTFVIGIGDVASLNEIARAGGTDKALIVSGSDPGQDFLDAMNQIRGAIGCQFRMPVPPQGEELDPGAINVAFTPSGQAQEVFKKVDGPSQCQGGPGWYYDNATNPTKILLCPSSCDRIEYTQGKVEVVVGCKSVIQ
jgi:hypothetical protein